MNFNCPGLDFKVYKVHKVHKVHKVCGLPVAGPWGLGRASGQGLGQGPWGEGALTL